MPDRFQPVPAGTDQNQIINAMNQNFAQLDQENTKKLMFGPDGIPSILIDSTVPVIKVSEPGVDVTTATDDQLNFNSSQNVLKVVLTGSTTINFNFPTDVALSQGQNDAQATVTHNLGYTPAVLAFSINFDGSYQPFASNMIWAQIGEVQNFMQEGITITDTAVYFSLVRQYRSTASGFPVSGISGTRIINYYILQETAA